MPALPNEILLKVIRHLRRPLPPPGRSKTTWKDVHQNDLAVMMRVSKLTHDLTAIVLYEEVVVQDLNLLLEGIQLGEEEEQKHDENVPEPTSTVDLAAETVPAPAAKRSSDEERKSADGPHAFEFHLADIDPSPNRQSKRDSLRKVIRLHLFESESQNQFYSRLWDKATQILNYGNSIGEWLTAQCPTQLYTAPEERLRMDETSLGDLMPGVQVMTLNTLSPSKLDMLWSCYMIKKWSRPESRRPSWWIDHSRPPTDFYNEVTSFEERFIASTRSLSPSSVCKTASSSPYTIWSPAKHSESKVLSNTIHISRLNTFRTTDWWSKLLLPGAINIIHLDLTCDSDYPPFSSDWNDPDPWPNQNIPELMTQAFQGPSDFGPEAGSRTQVHFYLERPRNCFDSHEDDSTSTVPDQFLADTKHYFLRALGDVNGTFVRNIEHRIKFFFADTMEPCPACGWDYQSIKFQR